MEYILPLESWSGLGWKGPSKAIQSCHEQGHFQPDQVAQCPIQTRLFILNMFWR